MKNKASFVENERGKNAWQKKNWVGVGVAVAVGFGVGVGAQAK